MKSIFNERPDVLQKVLLAWIMGDLELYAVGHLGTDGRWISEEGGELNIPTHWQEIDLPVEEDTVPEEVFHNSPVFDPTYWKEDPALRRSTPHLLDRVAWRLGILERRIEWLRGSDDIDRETVTWETERLERMIAALYMERGLLEGKRDSERSMLDRSPAKRIEEPEEAALEEADPEEPDTVASAANAHTVGALPLSPEEEARERDILLAEEFNKRLEDGRSYLQTLIASDSKRAAIGYYRPFCVLYALDIYNNPEGLFRRAFNAGNLHRYFKIMAFNRASSAPKLVSMLRGDWIARMDRAAAMPDREPRAGDTVLNLDTGVFFTIAESDLPLSN